MYVTRTYASARLRVPGNAGGGRGGGGQHPSTNDGLYTVSWNGNVDENTYNFKKTFEGR